MRILLPLVVIMVLFLAGCSSESNTQSDKASKEKVTKTTANQKEESNEEKDSTKDTVPGDGQAWWKEEPEFYVVKDYPRELTDTEQKLMRKPGTYSGKGYDAVKAKNRLDQLPKDATEDELKNAILSLIQEDYHEETEIFLRFDPSVNVIVARPDEANQEPAAAKSHFAILLDASGSMNVKGQSGTRMDDAKSAIQSFIENLPGNSTVSLRVYGHKGSNSDKDKALSCASTEVIYNGPTDAEAIAAKLSTIKATGWTPIGKALAETKNDIPQDAAAMIVYVVSDGIETCNGDPVGEAKKLAAEGIKPIINIIGFQVDNEAQTLLKQVAEAGNGEFSFVNSKQELEEYWDKEYDRMMAAWEEWQEEGMRRADEMSDRLMELAEETGNSIMEKSELEFDHAEELVSYLEEKEYKNADDLWSLFYDRSKELWGYGYNTSVDNWQEAYHNGIDVWQYFYHEGNAKWTEYYHK